jgi:hypothetical protein
MGAGIENAIQQKLAGIKYIDARRLGQEAQQSLGMPVPGQTTTEKAEYQTQVVEQALAIFEGLTPEEQAEMLQPPMEGEAAEPDWKRRAREQAEKRERAWEQEEAGATADPNAETESSDPELVEEGDNEDLAEGPWSTSTNTITTTKTRVVHPSSSRRGFDESGDPLHGIQAANVYHRTVYCVIL